MRAKMRRSKALSATTGTYRYGYTHIYIISVNMSIYIHTIYIYAQPNSIRVAPGILRSILNLSLVSGYLNFVDGIYD